MEVMEVKIYIAWFEKKKKKSLHLMIQPSVFVDSGYLLKLQPGVKFVLISAPQLSSEKFTAYYIYKNLLLWGDTLIILRLLKPHGFN